MKSIVVIGSGLSGLVLVSSLLEKENEASSILLIEKNPEQLGKGIAYKSEFELQPLNVRAGRMSIYQHHPNHFIQWIRDNYNYRDSGYTEHSFVPRSIYGEYLKSNLDNLSATYSTRFQIVLGEVARLEKSDDKWNVILRNEKEIIADQVVLAPGNFPPPDLSAAHPEIRKHPKYFPLPWQNGILASIPKDKTVLFVGMGLSTIDHLITLNKNKHTGKIIAISRNGLLPLTHKLTGAFVPNKDELLNGCETPIGFLKFLREKTNTHPNLHWSAIIDGIRPYQNQIWANWSIDQKKQFHRHIRPFWEIHRHRIPEESSELIKKLIENGQLSIRAGRKKGISLTRSDEFILSYLDKKSGNLSAVTTDYIVNCTGSQSDFRKIDSPLIKQLLSDGHVVLNDLQMGILTDESGRLIDNKGNSQPNLFTLGPTRKGQLWESVALNEIRQQAENISNQII
ncbi:MAG TPA: hypothetical protein DEP18_04140 [Flavobacteriales bacterium]|nr:hypothetical protein [Flavobacteriales bacterium]